MDVFLIVAPIFSLIVIGYVARFTRLLSETAHKGLTEFAFAVSVPALLFRTIATADFPAVDPLRVWAAYFGAGAVTWIIATLATRFILRRPAVDAGTVAIGSVYGNIALLGVPLCLAAFGPSAAGPMALIMAINTPVLWFAGTLQMGWAERKSDTSVASLLVSIAKDLARNPIVLGIFAGFLWRLTGLGIHAAIDKALLLVAQSAVPTALISLGGSLLAFRITGQLPTLATMCILKLVVLPLIAWWLSFAVLALPPIAAGVVVVFAAMPAGANVYIYAHRYQRVVNSASGAVALGTLLSVLTVAALIGALMRS